MSGIDPENEDYFDVGDDDFGYPNGDFVVALIFAAIIVLFVIGAAVVLHYGNEIESSTRVLR